MLILNQHLILHPLLPISSTHTPTLPHSFTVHLHYPTHEHLTLVTKELRANESLLSNTVSLYTMALMQLNIFPNSTLPYTYALPNPTLHYTTHTLKAYPYTIPTPSQHLHTVTKGLQANESLLSNSVP